MYFDKAAEGALLKLLAALPSTYRNAAERARQRIYVDVTGWSRPEEAVPLLPVLQQAIWLERQLDITYKRGPDCEPVQRLLNPLGLVAKGSVWYLVASVGDDLRSYRVSRICRADLTNSPSICPEDFDLAKYWEESARSFRSHLPNYVAKFRVARQAIPRLRFAGRFARVGEIGDTDSSGWIEVNIGFDVEEMACEYALGFGSKLEVLEPISLRDKVVEAAKELVDFYTRPRDRE